MKLKLGHVVLVAVLALSAMPLVARATRVAEGGRGDGPVIRVQSQELYYDAIVAADPLPWNSHIAHTFQLLTPTGSGLETEFGPGDPEYRGGRWWVDVGSIPGEQDADDHFFSCPLLGPGREAP
jgi:hypothetical protein